MSDAQHAPTPWQVHHEIDATGYPYFVLHGLSGKQKHDKAMLDATADMIAAAPDLLAALKCFVADERFIVSVGGNPIVVEKMIEAARAAIAKAEKVVTSDNAAIAKAEGKAP